MKRANRLWLKGDKERPIENAGTSTRKSGSAGNALPVPPTKLCAPILQRRRMRASGSALPREFELTSQTMRPARSQQRHQESIASRPAAYRKRRLQVIPPLNVFAEARCGGDSGRKEILSPVVWDPKASRGSDEDTAAQQKLPANLCMTSGKNSVPVEGRITARQVSRGKYSIESRIRAEEEMADPRPTRIDGGTISKSLDPASCLCALWRMWRHPSKPRRQPPKAASPRAMKNVASQNAPPETPPKRIQGGSQDGRSDEDIAKPRWLSTKWLAKIFGVRDKPQLLHSQNHAYAISAAKACMVR